MTSTYRDVTVYIGRFNPFHLGHAHVLKSAMLTSNTVIVLVGSSGLARSLKNPFTFEERKEMIFSWAKESGLLSDSSDYGKLHIIPIQDFPYSESTWISSVQNAVNEIVTDKYQTICLTGSDRDESTWYLHHFPQWELKLLGEFSNPPKNDNISATGVRKVLYESTMRIDDFYKLDSKVPNTTRQFLVKFARDGGLNELRAEYEFINKYKKSWEAAPYAPTFVTADAVVIQSGHILVVKRGALPGKGLLALPGGFVNQNERIEDASIRELVEETGIKLADGKNSKKITSQILKGSIKAKETFDKPDRSARGRTITVAYLFRLADNKSLPLVAGQNVPTYESNGKITVETEDAFWMPLDTALKSTNMWFEDHLSIIQWAVTVKD